MSPALPHVPSPEGMRGLRVQVTTSGRTCRRPRGVRDAPATADLGAAPTSPPGGVCEHGFHPFPNLGRLASLDALRAGSAGLQGRHRATGPPGQRTDEILTRWAGPGRAGHRHVGLPSVFRLNIPWSLPSHYWLHTQCIWNPDHLV
jgi:hypothetical protein